MRLSGLRGHHNLQVLRSLHSEASGSLYRVNASRSLNAVTSSLSVEAISQASEPALFNQEESVTRKTPTHGHTVYVKDNIVTSSLPTSCASNILRGYVAPQAATVVRLMEGAGLTVLGKTNMDEFGMGSHSTYSAFGPAMNGPRGLAISVGGSSGGSALAVAAGLSRTAIGTDTGGSVRLPAAYLNLIGFKPSYGLISRNGVVPYANSLDTVGILGKSCIDVISLFKILSVPDEKDPTCLTVASRQRIAAARRARTATNSMGRLIRITPLDSPRESTVDRHLMQKYGRKDFSKIPRAPRHRRIGVPMEYNVMEMHPRVRKAWMRLLNMLKVHGNHTVVPVSLPTTKQALSAYYVLAPAEASSNLAKYDGIRYGPARDTSQIENVLYSGHRGELFGDEVKRRILLGSYTLSASAMDNYFIQAQKIRRLVQRDFNNVFRMAHPLLPQITNVEDGVDFIVCPTAPTFPPSIKSLEKSTTLESYTNDVFTVPASLAGLPAVSVPAPNSSDSSPERAVGIQIIGQYGDDQSVLSFVRNEIEPYENWKDIRRLVPNKVRT